jgi:hypothetical protein
VFAPDEEKVKGYPGEMNCKTMGMASGVKGEKRIRKSDREK